MAGVEVVDALEDILRKEGVYDEIKQTLFLAVNSTMKKQKPILKNAKVKEFGSTTDGKFSLLLIADLLEKLNLKHSLEMFSLESGFTSTTDLKEGLTDKFGGAFSSSADPMLHQIVTGAAGEVRMVSHSADEHKQSSDFSPPSPPKEEVKSVTHTKKNRSPLSLHGSPPSSKNTSSFDLENSYDADDKSTTSMDRLHFSPDKGKKKKKKGGLSPLGPSPPKKSPLASISDKKGLPPLGNLDPLVHPSKRSLHKINSPNKTTLSSDELSHDSLSLSSSKKKHHDHLEDSFDQSLDEKLEESKDGFEISDSFENSDVNLKLDSPLSKQSSHILAPLGDVLSPYSTKSEKEEEKSYTLDDSQPEQLASASFLEESEISESSNMFDDDDCILLDSPKKSDTNPSQVNRVLVKQMEAKEETTSDPATMDDDENDNESNQVNVNVSTASTVRMMRSQVGWDDHTEDKDRHDDDFEYVETKGADSKASSNVDQISPGRSKNNIKNSNDNSNQSEEKENMKVDDYEVNSDFESIVDMDDYADDMKYDEDELLNDEEKSDLNTSHASYRSNQEEDEEENDRLDAERNDAINNDNDKPSASGSLFSSPPHSPKKENNPTGMDSPSSVPRSNKKKSLDETGGDDEDDYGDDFDDDFEDDDDEAAEELDESIAESLEEDLDDEEDDDQLSFGSKQDSDGDGDSDKDKSYMSSPSSSPTGKLPSLFTKSKLPEETKKSEKSFNDSDDSDPFQDKSGSYDDDGPETSLASKDDLEDFSVGADSSDGDEFLKDEDDESASATELSVKDQKSVGRLGDSNENEFSMSENEISGSHNLNDFADYTTSAAPPTSRRGGW